MTEGKISLLPYFLNVDPILFLTPRSRECLLTEIMGKFFCRFPGCADRGSYFCLSDECKYIFCKVHREHAHCCCFLCENPATTLHIHSLPLSRERKYPVVRVVCGECKKTLTDSQTPDRGVVCTFYGCRAILTGKDIGGRCKHHIGIK